MRCLMFNLLSTRTSTSFSARLFTSSHCLACTVAWYCSIPDTEFIHFQDHFSILSRFLLLTTRYSLLILLRMTSFLLSRSLIKSLSSIGPSISPWRMPQVNSHQLDFVSPITALHPQWLSEFSSYLIICLASPHLRGSKDAKDFAKVKLHSIHCSPLIHISQLDSSMCLCSASVK